MAAAPEATWSVLTDWERQSEWALLTTTRGIGPTRGHAVGEQVHAFTGIGRLVAELADRLELSGAAVRKHMDELVEAGMAEASDRPSYGPASSL